MDENSACLCFSLSDGIGPKTFIRLLKHFGSAKNAWKDLDSANFKHAGISENLYKKFDSFRKTFDLNEYLEKLNKTKVTVISYTSDKYPELLKQLQSPPIILFCKGNLELLNSTTNIGVVGARKITSYGKDVTEKLVSELVAYDFTIISGLAFGVDATAHKTALENNGKTIAVLGCGVDCCTPAENQDLYEKILDHGGLIISEYPLGQPPSAGSFPARNRIIAGLSLGVLITEAAEDSGSLITAEEARKLGRPVFAVPGSINSQMSKGALKLIRNGAILVQSSKDILETFEVKMQNGFTASRAKGKITSQKLKGLNTKEKQIVQLVENEAISLDLISKQTKIPTVKLMVLVSSLEMRGILENKNGEVKLKES